MRVFVERRSKSLMFHSVHGARWVAWAYAEALVNDSKLEMVPDVTGNRGETGGSTLGESARESEALRSFSGSVFLLRPLFE